MDARALGIAALIVYGVLLGVGGLIGYLKAGSRPSLIAGGASGAIALAAAALAYARGAPGFWIGLVLAVLMTGTFAARFRKTGKVMPSGMLAGVSVAMLAVLGWALSRLG